jgi:hypothetical protein
MISESNVRLTINFNDSSLEAEERDEQVQRLMLELKEIDDVETVERVLDTNPPEGNKALGGFLVGLLTAGVNAENAKRVLGFLGDRLSGKTIELEVEANGRKLMVKASSQAELAAAIEAAQKFVAA